jgi:hypothetical protein
MKFLIVFFLLLVAIYVSQTPIVDDSPILMDMETPIEFATRVVFIDEQTQLNTLHENVEELSRQIIVLKNTQNKMMTGFIIACCISFLSIGSLAVFFSIVLFFTFRMFIHPEMHENDTFDDETSSLIDDNETQQNYEIPPTYVPIVNKI